MTLTLEWDSLTEAQKKHILEVHRTFAKDVAEEIKKQTEFAKEKGYKVPRIAERLTEHLNDLELKLEKYRKKALEQKIANDPEHKAIVNDFLWKDAEERTITFGLVSSSPSPPTTRQSRLREHLESKL